jgi:hypothetical protein
MEVNPHKSPAAPKEKRSESISKYIRLFIIGIWLCLLCIGLVEVSLIVIYIVFWSWFYLRRFLAMV